MVNGHTATMMTKPNVEVRGRGSTTQVVSRACNWCKSGNLHGLLRLRYQLGSSDPLTLSSYITPYISQEVDLCATKYLSGSRLATNHIIQIKDTNDLQECYKQPPLHVQCLEAALFTFFSTIEHILKPYLSRTLFLPLILPHDLSGFRVLGSRQPPS